MIVLKKLGGIRLPALVSLFAAVVMLFCLLLPYAVVTDAYAEELEQVSDVVLDEELDMTGDDYRSFSVLSLSTYLNDLHAAQQDELLGWLYMALLILCALLCLFTILFSLLNKAIPTMIFTLLTFAPFYLYSLDLTQRGFIGGGVYEWGVGYYLFHAAVVVAVGGAIWLLIEKIKEKKAAKQA